MVNHGLAAKLAATDVLLFNYRLFSYKKFISSLSAEVFEIM